VSALSGNAGATGGTNDPKNTWLLYSGGDIAICDGDTWPSTQYAGFMHATKSSILNGGGLLVSDASAIFKTDSTSKGFMPPRMTTTQKNAISSPAEGLVLYDSTLHKLCVYTGSAWETVTSV